MQNSQNVKCPRCKSDNVRFRDKRNNWICDDCDCVFTIVDKHDTDVHADSKTKERIFISYGHDCTSIVNRIKRDIENQGYDVWLDNYEIKSGDYWRSCITDGIINSQAVLAFLSKHALREGGVCLDELAIAVGCNRNSIRTCLMDKESVSLIPSTINGIEYIDMTEWNSLKYDSFETWYKIKFKEILSALESVMSSQQDAALKELEFRLHPSFTFDNHLAELRKRFTQRKWLSDQINQWVEDKKKRMMLLTAYPGGGKSSFCIHYFHFHPLSVCLITCEQSIEGIDETPQILRDIAYQLSLSSPCYRKNLLWTLGNSTVNLENLSIQALFNFLICTPFQLEIDGNHAPTIIVIDGLDALDKGERNALSDLFSDSLDKLPAFVNILISSRHSSNIINNLGLLSRIDINPTSKETTDDLERFFLEEFPNECFSVIKKMAGQCHGSFLYASLIASTIKEGALVFNDNEVMPRIQQLYYRSMKKLFFTIDDYKHHWKPLALIIASGGEIPTDALQRYMEWLPFELNDFASKLIMFLYRRTDAQGCQWIGIVYPSFISWITDEAISNTYCIPTTIAYKELSNAIWRQYEQSKEFSDFELINIKTFLEHANDNERIKILMNDRILMQVLLDRIKQLQHNPRGYKTICALSEFCKDIACNINNEESKLILNVELPFLDIERYFISGNYWEMIERYNSHRDNISKYYSTEQSLNLLYMVATGLDLIGKRDQAVQYFELLYGHARQNKCPQFVFYALIGLLWNDHFSNVEKGKDLIIELDNIDEGLLSEESLMIKKLITARFNMSIGDVRNSLKVFDSILVDQRENIWGYNCYSMRIQMLLIESLVSAHDNYEYKKGIDLGLKIYSHIGDAISVASCYCASWLTINYIECGNYSEAEKILLEAEYKNEQLQKIGPSSWMLMHLKSVRSFLYAKTNSTSKSAELLKQVIELAKVTSDWWVLGDAYYELFVLDYFSKNHLLTRDEKLSLLNDLKCVTEQSGLPHLQYKLRIMNSIIYPDKKNAFILLKETQSILEGNTYASTNIILSLYFCLISYSNFFPLAEECNYLRTAIIQKANEIDLLNPGIHFSRRNPIVNLINNKK